MVPGQGYMGDATSLPNQAPIMSQELPKMCEPCIIMGEHNSGRFSLIALTVGDPFFIAGDDSFQEKIVFIAFKMHITNIDSLC